jgi:hypothetical protein
LNSAAVAPDADKVIADMLSRATTIAKTLTSEAAAIVRKSSGSVSAEDALREAANKPAHFPWAY